VLSIRRRKHIGVYISKEPKFQGLMAEKEPTNIYPISHHLIFIIGWNMELLLMLRIYSELII
jgi:hypothetical protein